MKTLVRFLRKKRWLILFLLFALFIAGWFVYKTSHEIIKDKNPVVEIKTKSRTEFGIQIDSMVMIHDQIEENQNITQLLMSYGVSAQMADSLVRKCDTVFDVRKIRAGNNYTALLKNDTSQALQYLIYEQNTTEYVVFVLKDSVHVHKGEKEIQRKTITSTGEIKSSLWQAIEEKGLSRELALGLEDIYQWSIDFFGLQNGDHFKVIYDELSVDGKSVGIDKIHAACFNHYGQDYFAFFFVTDSVGKYYNEKGESLKKAFLKAPLKFSKITSRFSRSRLHPILKIRRPHFGVDYSAPSGSPVFTIGDGTIVYKGYMGGGGNSLKIKHGGGFTSSYMHLRGYAPGIRQGTRVRQGELIAFVGSTGLSTGPHLDFRMYKGSTPIDPLKVVSPPAKPINEKDKARFKTVVDKYMPLVK